MTDVEKQPLLGRSEPSLSELQQNVSKAQREYMRAWSRTTNGRIHKYIMIFTTVLLSMVCILAAGIVFTEVDDAKKVQLEAHIMSKCPDAKDCLHDMVLPAMVQVNDKVDFKLSYIGNTTDHDDGVLCMHGPQECLGNIIELCAAKIYPEPKIYLGFTMCLTRDYKDIPSQELVQECALEHGISVAKLNDCAVDEDGSMSVNMLQDSFRRSSDANVSTSCTVRVDDEVFCVRDGGEWKNCKGSKAADLVAEIEKRYSAPSLRLRRDW